MKKKCCMKRIIVCMLILTAVLGLMVIAQEPIKVFVNNEEVIFDVSPVVENGRTLVPVRAICEALGCEIGWNAETKTVKISRDNVYRDYEYQKYDTLTTELQIDNIQAIRYGEWIDDDSSIVCREVANYLELDVPARIIDGRTLVPVRFISDELHYSVTWENYYRHIYIGDCSDLINELEEYQQSHKVAMYKPDGSVITVIPRDVEKYLANGWFKTEQEAIDFKNSVVLFAPDGDSIKNNRVKASLVEDYLKVGWYKTEQEALDARKVTMYAPDGRTISIKYSEIEAYKNVGWYTSAEAAEDSKKTTLYAEDGRTIRIYKTQVADYLKVGWYETKAAAEAAVKAKKEAAEREKDVAAAKKFRIGNRVFQWALICTRYGDIKDINYTTGEVLVYWDYVVDAEGYPMNEFSSMMYGGYTEQWVGASTLRKV